MIGFVLSNISLDLITSSVTLPVHEPISFGFEDIIKAKSEAAVLSDAKRRYFEMLHDNGTSFCGGEERLRDNLTDAARFEYIYDYNIAAELFAIKRRKGRK